MSFYKKENFKFEMSESANIKNWSKYLSIKNTNICTTV